MRLYLLFLLLFLRVQAFSQNITLEVYPSEPSLGDTVTIYAHVFYVMAECELIDHTITKISDSERLVESLRCVGIFTALCESTDSSKIVVTSLGLNTIKYVNYTNFMTFGETCLNPNEPLHISEDSIQFVVSPVGIDDADNIEFILYPNPVDDVVTIEFSGSGTPVTNICLYNVVGQPVNCSHTLTTGNSVRFSTQGIPNGIYSLALTTKEKVFYKKIIVRH